MSKHTPGPWIALMHNGIFVITDGGLTVADVTYQLPDVFGETTRKANARLIAAAPDLLEALIRVVFVLNDDAPSILKAQALRHADAAISKATGEA